MSNFEAMSSGSTPEEKTNLWSILPSFDPQSDDPREYRDKVKFLASICPKKDKPMLAPRLAMLLKGTAWAQIKSMDTEKLTDPDEGIKILLESIATWEEAAEMQVYDRFEKALYRTTQRSDEVTQSYVNRMAVAFHELGNMTVKDIRAFILLRQSSLTVEDKKRVLSMVDSPLTPEAVERAMRQLSTKVLVGQPEGKKKIYPVNYTEEDLEEVHAAVDTETIDEEQAIINLAEQGDEEALMIKDFEDQLIEVCQENQDLATCYSAYAEARAKIRDRLRHRGFWPVQGNKGKGKGGKKSGRFDQSRFPKKRESLADRIASSNCRRCGARGHWKWECPLKDQQGNQEDVNVAIDVTFSSDHEEILDSLPSGLQGVETMEQLMQDWSFQDWVSTDQTSLGIFNSKVNEEFTESIFVCTLKRQNVTGHCLGSALIGAMSRRVEGECRTFSRGMECPAIIDTGASKTVIGQRKVKALIQSMPSEIQRQMNWKKSETVFRFGNNAVLPSVGALYLPFGKRWMRIEVVRGETPFLLSNSFLRAIDADVCTRLSTLRLNQLGIEVPLKTNPKGLFVVQLADVIDAFSREHSCQNLEIVTNVISETRQATQQRMEASGVAKVAQRPVLSNFDSDFVKCNSEVFNGEPEGSSVSPRPSPAISRGSVHDLHDRECGGEGQQATGCDQSAAMGIDGDAGGQAQNEEFHGCGDAGPRVLKVDGETSRTSERLGSIVPELCQGLESKSGSWPIHAVGCQAQDGSGAQEEHGAAGMERRRGADTHRRGASEAHDACQERWQVIVQSGQADDQRREGGEHASGCESGAGGAASTSNCSFTRSIGSGDQEHHAVRGFSNNSRVSQNADANHDLPAGEHNDSTSVIQRSQEILCHLKEVSQHLEREVEVLVAQTAGKFRTRHAPRTESQSCRLDLLEIYCEPDSNLTKVITEMGMKAKRFTRQDGDLGTAEGQAKLWEMIHREQPRNIWVAPECKFWGNFSRWNSGRSPATAAKIQAGRNQQRVHLELCSDLYWYQVSRGRHFHLEQPQGSEATEQPELDEVVLGTYRTVFDMCEVGELKIPKGNNYLRKRTVVLTTSKEFHSMLDARYCRKNHQHDPILGQIKISGRWQNLSAFAAKYSRGFSKNVGLCLGYSRSIGEKPVMLEELCVPCFGLEEAEQQEWAGEILKRRRYSAKQGPRPGEEEDLSPVPAGLRYGPAMTWKEVFKLAGRMAPRVGSVVCDVHGDLFSKIEMLVHGFQPTHVEICRGTERYRLPKEGTDSSSFQYRWTIILNRESGEIEELGEPELWQTLNKSKKIRKAKPARICITVFGVDKGNLVSSNKDAFLGKNLADGDGTAKGSFIGADCAAEMQSFADNHQMEEDRKTTDLPKTSESSIMEMGYPPQKIPKHGPGYLGLEKGDRDWIRGVHHKMGHPDPQKLARFLQSTHAKPEIVSGALDYQCDACVESQAGFQSTRPAAIHDNIGFNEVVGMDMAYWTGSSGVRYAFVHFLDEGTLFHQARPCQEDALAQFQAFESAWLSWAGPPKEMYFDPATEYVSGVFLRKLQENGIRPKVTARDSHWQLGRTEVHGSIIKRMLDRMDQEEVISSPEAFRENLIQAVCAKNALSRVRGYTPEQAVLGVSRRLPGSITSDTSQGSHALAADGCSETDQFREALNRRSRARRAFIEADNCSSLRRALLRRTRPLHKPFEEGDWVLYWRRKGGNLRRERGRWYGPARVVQVESKNVVWVVHANQLVRAMPEQLRSASMREWQAVKDSEEAMVPVKTWIQRIQDQDFFNLEAEELPQEESSVTEPDPADTDQPPESGYSQSIAEPEGENLMNDGDEVVPGDLGGLGIPVGDDGDEEFWFGDTLDFWEKDTTRFWEIDVTPPSTDPLSNIENPEELVMMATDERKKRVEVSLKELGEEFLKRWLVYQRVCGF